jgi:hypothetical protein
LDTAAAAVVLPQPVVVVVVALAVRAMVLLPLLGPVVLAAQPAEQVR